MHCSPCLLLLTSLLACSATLPARAASWSPGACGDEPAQPKYDLTTREGYNDAVKRANGYSQAARTYADCVLKQAHADQTTVSRQAQNRIADIQTAAVSRQQAIYGRLATQAANFKAAAGRLKGR